MKIFLYNLLLCITVLAIAPLTSCDEDKKEISNVAIFITPERSDTLVAMSGDKLRYTVELYTANDHVKRLMVTSFDAVNGHLELEDTTFSDKKDIYYFNYSTPIVNRDSLNVTLTFEAWDNEGNTCQVERYVVVKNSTHLIEEMTGIVLHAPESALPNAFSLKQPSQTFCLQTSPDSLNADVYLVADNDFVNVALRSNTKAKMVRINTFDYPVATAASVQAVYESQRRSEQVDNLSINDIILIGHDDKAEGAIHITNIIRTGTSAEQCVQLSFKGITY